MQQIFGDTAKHITQSFNALSQRTQIARYQSTGATNLNTYAYTYDPLSRIATIVSTLEGTDTYSYDHTSQLVGATQTSQANETYGFDANGNRNTSGFTTGTNNQTTAGLGFTYTYDDEGNRTSKTETSTGKVEEYTWDHRNRLTKVVLRNTSGGAIVKQVDYEYDPYNRLVRRTFDADGAGAGAATNQYWVYDEGINAVLQFDGSSASNLSHRYLWSDNVDELLADEQLSGSNTLWGLADHLGSLRDIADYSESTGVTTIANHRTLNSFGKLVSETNAAVDMLFAFTGKQFDEATGLQHNLFRWLDPTLGLWLNEDPIGFAAGDENVRRYISNGVVDSIDPTGLIFVKPKTSIIYHGRKSPVVPNRIVPTIPFPPSSYVHPDYPMFDGDCPYSRDRGVRFGEPPYFDYEDYAKLIDESNWRSSQLMAIEMARFLGQVGEINRIYRGRPSIDPYTSKPITIRPGNIDAIVSGILANIDAQRRNLEHELRNEEAFRRKLYEYLFEHYYAGYVK